MRPSAAEAPEPGIGLSGQMHGATLLDAADKAGEYGTAKNWIDGEWVDSAKHTDSFNPATGQRIGSYADASHADVNAARNIAAGHAVTARGGDGVTRPVNREPQLLLQSA